MTSGSASTCGAANHPVPLDPPAQIGVELLFERLHDSGAKAGTEVLPVELVMRESAVPPAGDAS
jgi:hypothetical protein